MFLPPSDWWIFSYFYPIRKYSKYFLNLTFGWECNDTPSLKEMRVKVTECKTTEISK